MERNRPLAIRPTTLENLKRIGVFVAVVEHSGFSAAAKELHLTRSAVSRQVARLERDLGVRLLNRTTRRLSLTEAGERLLESARRILAEAATAEAAVKRLHDEPRGTLRISGPVISHRLLVAVAGAFLDRYPEVSVDMTLEDRYVDLVDERIDVAARIGHPTESGLITRKLADVRQVVCGSPAYFARRGVPQRPTDLGDHEWVTYSLLASPSRFRFEGPDGVPQTVRVAGRLSINGGPAIREALLAGQGLTVIPQFYVEQDLASGRLAAVLPEHRVRPTALYAVYPHRDHLPSKVRCFVDLLAASAGSLAGLAQGRQAVQLSRQ